MPRSIEEAVADGLAALARLQTPAGAFPFYVGSAASGWRRCDPTFSTAYIMMSAGRLLAAEAAGRALDFLASRRDAEGLWNYDPALRIPSDADTTACALAALALAGRHEATADGAALLRTFWRPEAGPFRTWRTDGDWTHDARIDPVVNCNVLHALRLLGAPASAAERAAVEALVRASEQGSAYYSSPGAIALACHRAGIGEAAWPPIVLAPPSDALGLLQWYTATGWHGDRILPRALAAQRPDGTWPVAAWVTGRELPSWGSPAVTTALAVEALLAWLERGGPSGESSDAR